MPKQVAPLTPSAVANAKGQSLPNKLRDGRGLYLLVQPDGAKGWRFDYRRPGTGRRNTLSLGRFPEITLKRAREKREEVRALLAEGIDPGAQRQTQREAVAETFEALAREWLGKQRAAMADATYSKATWMFEDLAFPWIGARPVSEINAPEILSVLRRIEARGKLETAHRLKQQCSRVFRYAIATGRASRDPCPDLRGALASPVVTHRAAITDPLGVGELLRTLHGYQGSFVTACALRLAPLTFVRPGELRHAEWTEIDLDAAEWRLPAGKMKSRKVHIVPLSAQAVALLREIHPLTGRGRYVFPGVRSHQRPMSENTVLAALRRMGYEKGQMSGHGFRAMARSLLAELGWTTDAIERQLAHKASGPLGAAYDRAQYLEERRRMMQAWADYLDSLARGESKVVPLRAA